MGEKQKSSPATSKIEEDGNKKVLKAKRDPINKVNNLGSRL